MPLVLGRLTTTFAALPHRHAAFDQLVRIGDLEVTRVTATRPEYQAGVAFFRHTEAETRHFRRQGSFPRALLRTSPVFFPRDVLSEILVGQQTWTLWKVLIVCILIQSYIVENVNYTHLIT